MRERKRNSKRERETDRQSRLVVRRRWKSRNEQQLPDLTVAHGIRQGRIFPALETPSTKLRGLTSGSYSGFTNRGNGGRRCNRSNRRDVADSAMKTGECLSESFPPSRLHFIFFPSFEKIHSTRRPEERRPPFASSSRQRSLPFCAVRDPLRVS